MIRFEYAKSYCKDDISLIENYDKAVADKEQTWDCHHRRESETPRKELIEIREYYNRPANELIFLTRSEHKALHNTLIFKDKPSWIKGKHWPEEAKRKMSIAKKGKNRGKTPWNKGIPCSTEAKQKMSNAIKGRHLFNNGIISVRAKSCPEGFVKGRLKKSV